MSLTLKDIAIKLAKGELPPMSSDELARERIKVCEACPHMTRMTRQCNLCGCFLDLKTKLLEATCPEQKW